MHMKSKLYFFKCYSMHVIDVYCIYCMWDVCIISLPIDEYEKSSLTKVV